MRNQVHSRLSDSRQFRYGSPTILIDGRDVAGLAPGDEQPSCRIYDNGAGALDVVPSVERIADALRR